MADNQDEVFNINSTRKDSSNFLPNRMTGILLSSISLFLLGILPIISNSRPPALNALNFAFFLSLWELICSLPLFFVELRKKDSGIFQNTLDLKIKKKTLLVIGFTSIIFSASTFLYVLAFETAGTVSAAIAMQTYPLFSILMEFLLFKKMKKVTEFLFTVIMLIGIYYLGTDGTWLINGFSPWFALALIVPFLWSIAHVIIKNTLDTSPITPNQVTFLRVLVSSIILFFINLILYGSNNLFNGLFNLEFQTFGFFMGLVYYLELVNWFYAVKHVEVSLASAITTPTPIITIIFAIFILNESIEIFQLIALITILTSLYGILWSGRVKTTSSNS